jgi:hypothetical protein
MTKTPVKWKASVRYCPHCNLPIYIIRSAESDRKLIKMIFDGLNEHREKNHKFMTHTNKTFELFIDTYNEFNFHIKSYRVKLIF